MLKISKFTDNYVKVDMMHDIGVLASDVNNNYSEYPIL